MGVFKRLFAAMSVCSLLGCISACGTNTPAGVSTTSYDEINSVKNAYMKEYSTEITVGEAVDDFLEDAKWQYYKTDTGDAIVECAGVCLYDDENVNAKIQFRIVDEESFDVYGLILNGKAQSEEMIEFFFDAAYGIDGYNDYGNDESASANNKDRGSDAAQDKMGQYLDQCIPCTYEDLARDPNIYKGSDISISAEVTMIVEEAGSSQSFLMATMDSDTGIYMGNSIYVQYTRPAGANRILEGDEVVVHGEYQGMDDWYNAPYIKAKYILY